MEMYRAKVVLPLFGRERMHNVYWYRVGATSKDDALAKVRKEIEERNADGFSSIGWRIVYVERFCAVDRVILDSVTNTTKDAAAAEPTLWECAG
jgi:hypothetical protein